MRFRKGGEIDDEAEKGSEKSVPESGDKLLGMVAIACGALVLLVACFEGVAASP